MQDSAPETGTATVTTASSELTLLHHKSSGWSGRFDNPWATWQPRGFRDLLRWSRERRKLGVRLDGWLLNLPHPTPADFAAAFPLNTVNYAALNCPPPAAIQALWVGHATVLVQMEGVTFLTDPVLSERCSPVQWAGPKRVVPTPLDLEHPQLPHVDFVVISHNHYDHLDRGSVMRLHRRFGQQLRWYVPLGLAAWFKSCGITNVIEMDWWQEALHPGTELCITLTPAQHWSSRKGWDRCATLWGGYAVRGQSLSFWFAGDTGRCPVHEEIGERLGPFDLAAIPIGAYEPRWFMKPQHCDPGEAVGIHQAVKSSRSIGIHAATFSLTDEALDEPPALLLQEVSQRGLASGEFTTLQHGALLQTAGGVDANAPPTLPVQAPV